MKGNTMMWILLGYVMDPFLWLVFTLTAGVIAGVVVWGAKR
jgi:hypothetical protein